jgi:hypothetical protein
LYELFGDAEKAAGRQIGDACCTFREVRKRVGKAGAGCSRGFDAHTLSELRSILSVITCFTIAHSITLGLATLDIVRLPGESWNRC